jgi:hypothetical protein
MFKYVINVFLFKVLICCCCFYTFRHPEISVVLDEPLYAHFLRETKVDRPYLELMKDFNSDGNDVVSTRLNPSNYKNQVIFVKHIAKQVVGLSKESLDVLFSPETTRHIFLTRHFSCCFSKFF